MSRAILDASILLAYIRKEPHANSFLVADLETVVSSVNLAEVHSKLIAEGATEEQAWFDATRLADEIVPFSPEHARRAGSLISSTKRHGLSLGDRACLALGLELNLPVYTTDRIWREVEVGVKIVVVR